MIRVQQAAHDIPKKKVPVSTATPRTQHSSPRTPDAFKLVFTASPWGSNLVLWTRPLPNCGALHSQSAVPIFSGHEVCLLDNLYPNSRSTWHSPPAIVRCPLAQFMQHSSCESPWHTRHRLKLPNCAAPGAGALRAC